MIEEQAEVIAAENGYAWVEPRPPTACHLCPSGASCGVAIFSRLLRKRQSAIRAINPVRAGIGDSVIVGIDEHVLVRSALAMYAVPLISMLIMAIGAGVLAGHSPYAEAASIAGGFAGLGAALLGLRRLAGTVIQDHLPIIVERMAVDLSSPYPIRP